MEETGAVLYHCAQNPRAYHTDEPKGIVFDLDQGPGVEFVLNAYPEAVSVSTIPMGDVQDRLDIASMLYEQGIVLVAP